MVNWKSRPVWFTLDVTVHHLGPILGRRLLVTGRSLKVGRSICLAEASAHTEDGRLVGQGTSKLLVRNDGPSILDLLNEQLGHPPAPKIPGLKYGPWAAASGSG